MSRYIIKERHHSHGGLFELEIDYYYDVVDTKSQKTLLTFNASYSAEYGGADWENGTFGGVEKLEISPDEQFVWVYYRGKAEPEKVKIPNTEEN